jgi:hypothetical protein
MRKLVLAMAFGALTMGVAMPTHATATATTTAALRGPHLMPTPSPGPHVFASVPPAGAHLTYFGGRVVSNIQVVQVLWGAGTFAPEVTATGKGSISQLFTQLTTSSYLDWLKEYNANGQTIGRGTFAGQRTITPSNASVTTISDDTIQAEITAQIIAGHLPPPTTDSNGNDNTYYALYFPHGDSITAFGATSCVYPGFIAYHGTIAASTNVGEIYYGVHPDEQTGSGCEPPASTSDSRFQYESTAAAHELVETITDPEVGIAPVWGPPLSWYDQPDNGEIADLCDPLEGDITGTDGDPYRVQQELSSFFADTCIVTPPDFSVTTSPPSVSLPAGTSTVVSVPLPASASNVGVDLTMTGAPANVTTTLDSSKVAPGTSTNLTIDATAATVASTSTLHILSSRSSISHDTPISVTITPPAPDPPTSVAAVAGAGSVKVSWTAPAYTGNSALTGYTVKASPGLATCTTATTACTVTGLTNGTLYTFRVQSHNSTLDSALSAATVPVAPRTVPGAPRTPISTPLKAAATVAWFAPLSNGGSAITKYTVTATPGGHTCSTTATVLHCNVTALTNGVSYRFSVTATNVAGTSTASTLTTAIVAGSPSTPRSLAATYPANAKATVTWFAPLSIGSGAITGYQVRWSGNGGLTWTSWSSTGVARSASRSPLTKGHKYLVQVRAANHSGAGPVSSLTFTQPR